MSLTVTDNAISSRSRQTEPPRAGPSTGLRRLRQSAALSLDDFQAVPEAILLDLLPEFRTGDQCELMYQDELSLVGWPKGCRMDRKLAGDHGRRGGIRAVIHHGERPVVRRLGLTAHGGHLSDR